MKERKQFIDERIEMAKFRATSKPLGDIPDDASTDIRMLDAMLSSTIRPLTPTVEDGKWNPESPAHKITPKLFQKNSLATPAGRATVRKLNEHLLKWHRHRQANAIV